MSAVDKAKDTLLRALDELERAEQDLGQEPERVDLVVIYSIGYDDGDGAWQEVGGWAATAGPKWIHVVMLRRAADAQEEAMYAQDDGSDDEA
jgi:hypothetical protein